MEYRHELADPYARIAAYYDLEHEGFADDIPFYLNSIESVGDPVLELGCGSGRLVRPIADAGWRITGLDRSGPMLDRLRASIASSETQASIQLHQAEMAAADDAPGGPFGVVIFSLNGLLHLADPDAQIEALAAAHRALDPRGQLIIDVMNPTLDSLQTLAGGMQHEGSWPSEDGTVVEKFSFRRIQTAEQRIETRLWYDRTDLHGNVQRTATAFDLRYVHRHELELMLRLTGFQEWQIYGGYELEPYDDRAERLIVAAEP